MNQEMVTQAIKKHKVVAILRGIERESVEPVIDALYEGGILSLIHISSEVWYTWYSAPAVTVGALRISWRKPTRVRA